MKFECKYNLGDRVEFNPGTGKICTGCINGITFYKELEPKYSIIPDSRKIAEYYDTFESSLKLIPTKESDNG